ncbi:MAG: ATP-dependent DNA ligase [Acidimicrobiia bacterium]|nr:ATP-dependent DNA ligase [Acidimicrobiia bacterium]
MLLKDVVVVSNAVAAAAARNEKIALLADAVAALDEPELASGVSYLAGVLPEGSIGVGYATLRDLPSPAAQPELTVTDVEVAIAELANLSGPGSTARRQEALHRLFGRATDDEHEFLAALLVGGLRQGASEKVVMDAVAKASGVPATLVRRAVMFSGNLGEVATIARRDGREGLERVGLRIFRPVLPMLAKTAGSAAAGLDTLGEAAVERKIDGARIQAHLAGGEVRIFTRNLNDVTDRLPEIVAVVQQLNASSVLLDGEAIALQPNGRPFPFQVTMARFGSETETHSVELTPFFFDLLHLDGSDVLDLPLVERIELLDRLVPENYRLPRLITADPAEVDDFFATTIRSGHEGIMIKALDTRYEAGRRGAGWLKVKPVHTLDLVVLAVEWGSGRRHGWLSNIHLGARDPEGGFVMLGKTFKGMTDAILEWQTKRFLELETHREGHVVYVRPEQVVEIAIDGVQRSSRYPGGMALRFARVKGYREDKTAAEADTIDMVRAVFEGQTGA